MSRGRPCPPLSLRVKTSRTTFTRCGESGQLCLLAASHLYCVEVKALKKMRRHGQPEAAQPEMCHVLPPNPRRTKWALVWEAASTPHLPSPY